ncbi:hypothetical protein AB0M28_17970 [Streptomyces sp. NPDC051940]
MDTPHPADPDPGPGAEPAPPDEDPSPDPGAPQEKPAPLSDERFEPL